MHWEVDRSLNNLPKQFNFSPDFEQAFEFKIKCKVNKNLLSFFKILISLFLEIPSSESLLLEDATLTNDGGIDFEIIVTGSSSGGNEKGEGCDSPWLLSGLRWSSASGDEYCSADVSGFTSRLSGSSFAEVAFGILERSKKEFMQHLQKC